ncbi:TonB-dependent siderophore receptor [Comamonas antarctica]|uniref:TonB-dependent receptor plug domain-containing protein n=1 Tax=Comamonas antarctica TaxID=2743470 RepID=A0A6N1X8N1_9BURK|nr:TonB-dependent receptor plug domain-containing protein [Comamonas antarctica]
MLYFTAFSSRNGAARAFAFHPLAAALALGIGAHASVQAQSRLTDEARWHAVEDGPALPTVAVTASVPTVATETSGSYTTGVSGAATRLPLALRETPQSATVITRQRMDDQQLNSVKDVLENTTGISSRTLDSGRISFYARGFAVDSFQYDGIPTTFFEGASFLDTAFYDRIEVVRGATGLLTGAGNPSASTNLVRKRPRQDFHAAASVGAGSWDSYRAMADIEAPSNS